MVVLVADEVPLGVSVGAGVTVQGTEVIICCLIVDCVAGNGDGQDLLPPVFSEDDVVAEGAIMYHPAMTDWIASASGLGSFRVVSNRFVRATSRRSNCAVDDGGV